MAYLFLPPKICSSLRGVKSLAEHSWITTHPRHPKKVATVARGRDRASADLNLQMENVGTTSVPFGTLATYILAPSMRNCVLK
jgi:hypothetical protein